MIYEVKWTFSATRSYFEEVDFIYQKWTIKEVVNFEKLVNDEIFRISQNPLIGKLNFKNSYSLTLSKQTTLFYRVNEKSHSIELILFWNNLKNPNDLLKLL